MKTSVIHPSALILADVATDDPKPYNGRHAHLRENVHHVSAVSISAAVSGGDGVRVSAHHHGSTASALFVTNAEAVVSRMRAESSELRRFLPAVRTEAVSV